MKIYFRKLVRHIRIVVINFDDALIRCYIQAKHAWSYPVAVADRIYICKMVTNVVEATHI